MVQIKNEFLTAEINEHGAELRSLKKAGEEYIWQGDPTVWKSSAPILFPICGGLKDDKYILNGKEYNLIKHGFAQHKEFVVESKKENQAVFLLKDDDETLKVFPFKFEFRAIFTLEGESLITEYRVKNLSEDTMYFALGAHEGYATPEGIEDYDIIFPQKETLNAVMIDGTLLQKHTLPIINDSQYLPLYDKYFLIDALVFKDVKSKSAILRNRKTGKEIKIDYPDCDYLLLWHKYASAYICFEPWTSIPDEQDSDYDITKKEGITALSPKKEYKNTHIITVVK